MEELFKEKAKTIKIFCGVSQEIDPYEHTIQITMLNPLPIKAIITDLVATQSQWKMPGIVTEKAKEIIIEKKYESLLLKSQKIQVDNDYYVGWKQNGRLQYRIEGNFLRAYIYIRKS